jgi:integrase
VARALAQGVVPAELLAQAKTIAIDNPPVKAIVREYLNGASNLTASDSALLGSDQFLDDLADARLVDITFDWAEAYVRRLKGRRLSPSTVRIRVGALGRVLDWHLRRTTPTDQRPPANAMRLLPRGYSTYNAHEAEALKTKGHAVPRTEHRDRRLAPEEEHRIERAFAGEKLEGKQAARRSPDDAHLRVLFRFIVETGCRLREAYRTRIEHLDFARGLIHVQGSKGRAGALKPRLVPMKPELRGVLQAYLGERTAGLVFPYWNGVEDEDVLRQVTLKLTRNFAGLFAYADCEGITEHDLRHEATCRWVTLRDARTGAWLWSDTELCRIMGWTSTRMLMRYASLRGEDLADRLALAYAPSGPTPDAPRAVVNANAAAAPAADRQAPRAGGADVRAFAAGTPSRPRVR